MTNHPLAIYLEDCLARRKTGATTPETSLYNPLETLLNAVGSKLKKPRVRCFMNLKDQDAGLPDGGLFTPDQFEKGNEETPTGDTLVPFRQGSCVSEKVRALLQTFFACVLMVPFFVKILQVRWVANH